MKLILITAQGRFIPKVGDNSGFEVLPTQVNGCDIFKKVCDDFLVYITKCISDESQPQLDKHNYLAAIVDIIGKDAGDIDCSEKYLIAHDGDLLEFMGGKFGRNGVFSEAEFSLVDTSRGRDLLSNRFPDKHIFIFQHEPIYKMFSKVISRVKKDFSSEQILTALDIIKDEA